MRRLRLKHSIEERGEFLVIDQSSKEQIATLRFDNGSPRTYRIATLTGQESEGHDLVGLLRSCFGEMIEIDLL
jgi:hypothetical protein